MEAARDAVQACRDCAEIAAAMAAASPDALASPSAWIALDEYEKTVKGGPAYALANVGGTSGTVCRIMHAPTPPGPGAERLEQALWLEGLWYSLHPDARPKKPGGKPKKRPAIYSIIAKERCLYFASIDYFFGQALPRAGGTVAAHLGKSFLFMGLALAAQAGIDWPDKASPLAVRVAGAFRRGGKPDKAPRTRGKNIPREVKKAVLKWLDEERGGDVREDGWVDAMDAFAESPYYTPLVQKYVGNSALAMKRIAKAARVDAQRRKPKTREQKK